MKIQKPIQIKWEFQQSQGQRHIIKIKNRGVKHRKSSSFGNIFGLPQSILQQPKLSQIKTLIKAKNDSFKQFLQQNKHTQHKITFNNTLRNTLTNRVRQILSPKRKQKMSLQASNSRSIDNLQGKKSQKNKKNSKVPCQPSKKIINLLQQIIFQQTTYKPKQKVPITLQANKLPTIEIKDMKDIKRKKLLAAYQQKQICTKTNTKNDANVRRKSHNETNKQKKPYFSGWEVTQTNDF